MSQLEVSVVLPCLNEEKGIAVCIKKIQEIFARDRINGEIIVSDNGSTDNSIKIARDLGATVVQESEHGYGAAYLRGLKEAKGKFIIMGDSDNTYDFCDIPKFLERLREGYDFVMGSRFKGNISAGAMPWANRYIGNPILSGMTRIFFHTRLSDIHCGMRGFTREAVDKMDLNTLGMEFATEMVVAAIKNNLRIYEVPINYYPRVGESKLVPLTDAWRHIRFMLLYCPLWLYFIPGTTGFLAGIGILLALMFGPIFFLGHYWDIHLMIYASALAILSFQVLNIGVFAHIFAINRGMIKEDLFCGFLARYFNLERGLLLGFVIFLAGFIINLTIFIEWLFRNFGALDRIKESLLAMTLLVIGLQTIFSSFFISLLFVRRR